jgi:phosphoenolpyruvate synthase/pyruvate phosphate dikinase
MKKEYVAVWEETFSSFIMDIFAKNILQYPYIIGNDIKEYLSFKIKGGLIRTYYLKEEFDNIKEEHGKYFLDISNFKRLVKKYDELLERNKEISERISKINLSELDNKELGLLYKELIDFLFEAGAYYRSTRPEGEKEPAKIVRDILAQNYEDIDEEYGIITDSIKESIILRHRKEWLSFLAKENVDESDLLEHIERFPCFYNHVWNKKEIVQMLKEKHRREKLERKNFQLGDKKLLEEKQEEIFKRCNNKKLVQYAKMIQDFAFYRFDVKDIWAGAELRLLSFFEEIAKRMKMDVKDIFRYVLIDDINKFFGQDVEISKEEMNKRRECLAVIIKDGKYEIKNGAEALDLLKEVEPIVEKVSEVKGSVAYKGIVRGRARIIYPYGYDKAEEEARKLNKGDILITTHTQPSMVPLMAKTSAMVSDTGGITCHTAIIAREFQIPCVVGTKDATKVFKDGDLIEVDATKGIVRKI